MPSTVTTWAAMEQLVQQGLVRSIGMSNFSRKKAEGLLSGGVTIRPAVLQVMITCLTNGASCRWAGCRFCFDVTEKELPCLSCHTVRLRRIPTGPTQHSSAGRSPSACTSLLTGGGPNNSLSSSLPLMLQWNFSLAALDGCAFSPQPSCVHGCRLSWSAPPQPPPSPADCRPRCCWCCWCCPRCCCCLHKTVPWAVLTVQPSCGVGVMAGN